MNEDDPAFRATYERLRSRMEALKNAPALDKARTFLKTYCASADGLDAIEDQLRHTLQFNAIPVWTGLEGLEAVLDDPTTEPRELVALVQRDANQQRVEATPGASRDFLGEVVGLVRRLLGVEDEPEGSIVFSPDFVVTLPNTEGRPERLRCVDMLKMDDATYAVLVSVSGAVAYTVYKYETWYEEDVGQRMTYELVTGEARSKVLRAAHLAGMPLTLPPR